MDFVTPSGFRDILPDEALRREQIISRVQACLASRGYAPIETPTLENIEVLDAVTSLPGVPFRFFDASGDLLALRPDVTMQVARMCATRLRGEEGPFRFRYVQRVLREADGMATSREVTQVGIENIDAAGAESDAEILALFAESLQLCGLDDFIIALGTASVLRTVLAAAPASGDWKNQAMRAYQEGNFVELARLAALPEAPAEHAQVLCRMARIRGGREAIDQVRELVAPLACDCGLDELETAFGRLTEMGLEGKLLVDFSLSSTFSYYTGFIFEAYAPGLGERIGSGGRYDAMIAAFDGKPRPSAGFALYLEQVMAALDMQPRRDGDCPLRIAVPKGSLNAGTIEALSRAGLDTAGLENPGRQLIISNPGVDYIIVRPTDAPVFVSLGAADCGICGKDSLLEAQPNVIELVDLQFGGCRFVVAEPAGATPAVEERYRKLGSIRVATKYPRITRSYYDRVGMQVEIVKLHGNIELAPLTGMAERIIDITATGTTLRENNLSVVDEVLDSTARFFANPCAFRTDERVIALAAALQDQVEEQ